jgi:ubiquinone biosynthesis protein
MKLVQTARRFDMKMQPNLLLLQKSMVIIEGVGRQLYPDINMWEVAKPLVSKWMMKERFSPAVADRTRDRAEELLGAASELPVGLNNLVTRTLGEKLKLNFALERIETVSGEINEAGRRIAWGVMAASIVIAATLIGVFSEKYTLGFLGLPIITWAGYLVAAAVTVKLFVIGGKRRD